MKIRVLNQGCQELTQTHKFWKEEIVQIWSKGEIRIKEWDSVGNFPDFIKIGGDSLFFAWKDPLQFVLQAVIGEKGPDDSAGIHYSQILITFRGKGEYDKTRPDTYIFPQGPQYFSFSHTT